MGDFGKARQKPPLGVMPEMKWKEQRIVDLLEAINRYMYAAEWPQVEWIREMADLVEWCSANDPFYEHPADDLDPDSQEPADDPEDRLAAAVACLPSVAAFRTRGPCMADDDQDGGPSS